MKGMSEQATSFDEGIEMVVELVRQLAKDPKKWRLLRPRDYANRKTYFNPRLNSGFMAVYLEFMFNQQPNKVEIDCIMSTWEILENLVPTYYVGQEFAEALVHTDPPENMVMKDLHWPFSGMVFVLPEQFQFQYFRHAVPFLRVAKVPCKMHHPPKRVTDAYHTTRAFGYPEASYGENAIIITATVMENGRPVDYSGSFPETYSLGDMLCNDNYEVFFRSEERDPEVPPPASDEADRQVLKKIISLVGHLLLAMTAVPEQIEPPQVIFPLKEKIQRRTPEQNWMWQPHFIGRNYRWERERSAEGEGTHASPRLHPRRGHWRHQPIGPRVEDKSLRQHKVIWIRPTLVGAKPERTDDAKTE